LGTLETVLLGLEVKVRALAPRITFFFGDDDEIERQKTPPCITWVVEEAEALQDYRDRPETTTRSFMDDLVVIRARCTGLVPQGQRSAAYRRQQLEASIQVMLALSWVLTARYQGAIEDRGWRAVNPKQVADAHTPVDYTFALRVARMEPVWEQGQFTTFVETLTLVGM
jgi:hypothetical protein